MSRLLSSFTVLCAMIFLTPVAQTANGDALVGIGPISPAMGGSGTRELNSFVVPAIGISLPLTSNGALVLV